MFTFNIGTRFLPQNLAYNLNLNAPGKFLQHDAATAAAAAAARAAAYPHSVPGAAAAAAAAHHTASGNFQPGFPVTIMNRGPFWRQIRT